MEVGFDYLQERRESLLWLDLRSPKGLLRCRETFWPQKAPDSSVSSPGASLESAEENSDGGQYEEDYTFPLFYKLLILKIIPQ